MSLVVRKRGLLGNHIGSIISTEGNFSCLVSTAKESLFSGLSTIILRSATFNAATFNKDMRAKIVYNQNISKKKRIEAHHFIVNFISNSGDNKIKLLETIALCIVELQEKGIMAQGVIGPDGMGGKLYWHREYLEFIRNRKEDNAILEKELNEEFGAKSQGKFEFLKKMVEVCLENNSVITKPLKCNRSELFRRQSNIFCLNMILHFHLTHRYALEEFDNEKTSRLMAWIIPDFIQFCVKTVIDKFNPGFDTNLNTPGMLTQFYSEKLFEINNNYMTKKLASDGPDNIEGTLILQFARDIAGAAEVQELDQNFFDQVNNSYSSLNIKFYVLEFIDRK